MYGGLGRQCGVKGSSPGPMYSSSLLNKSFKSQQHRAELDFLNIKLWPRIIIIFKIDLFVKKKEGCVLKLHKTVFSYSFPPIVLAIVA